jgi:ABC-type branched-subunit amino acid transport system ATPase component
MLRIQALSKSFSGVRALASVDVDVHEGEILGLVGPNGSGKTTMFNCVTGFVRPSSGKVIWHGQDVSRLAPDQIARLGVVRTFQQKMVFPKVTVQENLAIAWGSRRKAKGDTMFAGCDEIIDFLGLQGMQEAVAEDIPFGSARKLGLGIALAAAPKLLLLDEPAAGLNQDESQELSALIRRITERGVTVWIIEHDVALVMSTCKRIIVLHAGEKIAEGEPAQVANDSRVISVYLGEKFARRSEA